MRVKAIIEDEHERSSVEFSLEEMIGHSPGLGWSEMDEEGRLHALEDYAAWLYTRQSGTGVRSRVRIDPSTLPR
ncbi:MAG TPA: hypothetical protein VM406_07875 [Noviherbaspirillum sp.]|nr:hypothetical protein [Noviherbaspirillum sp.]